MNRRAFLTGVSAVAVAAAMPPMREVVWMTPGDTVTWTIARWPPSPGLFNDFARIEMARIVSVHRGNGWEHRA
jgi:hypothetical protein